MTSTVVPLPPLASDWQSAPAALAEKSPAVYAVRPTRGYWLGRPRKLALLATIVAAAVMAPPAFAHGAKRLERIDAGNYRAEVYALLVRLSPTRDVVDFTTYLRDRRTDRPVDGARVRVTARTPDGVVGPLGARASASTYGVLVPVREPNEWRQFRLHVTIRGPLGAAGFDYAPPSLASAWQLEPVVLIMAAIASLLFTQGFVRLRRRRRDHAPWSRPLLFGLGLALATLPLVSPLDAVGDTYLLSAHMLQHVLIGDAAPALILLSLRGPLLFFFLPKPILAPLARLGPLRAVLSFLLRPRVSFAAWAAVIAGWHVPAAYDYTLSHQAVHDLEHAAFVLVGVLVWTQLVDPDRHGRLSVGQRAAYAVALFAAGQVLSDVLVFSAPLYPAYAEQPDRLFGLSPAADQVKAGLVMMGEQIVTLGTCAALLLWAHVERLGVSYVGEQAAALPEGAELARTDGPVATP